ncbi:calcium-translocating P-type ATPase, SERCA-type, partial [Reticulomyxa filosa]
KLKEFEAKTAVIVRDGEIQKVDRSVLVPGDLVILSVGEKVPADCRILDLQSRTLQSDQSMLTGESHAINKSLDAIPKPKQRVEVVDQDKRCTLFSFIFFFFFKKKKGTLIVHGKCRAVVVLTGSKTSMGKIHEGLTEESDQKTPLGEKLDEFAEFLSKVISGICVVVWLINFNHFTEHGSWVRGAMYYLKIAVALAVAAIPEGLPAVVTTCLALGTRRMAKKNAIVKSLPSVETLGCTTVICSDKTGTLTTNQMSVRRVELLDFFFYSNIFMMTIEHASKNSIDIHHYRVTGTTYDPIGNVLDAEVKNEDDAKLLYPCEKPALRWISKVSCLCNDANITYDRKDVCQFFFFFNNKNVYVEVALPDAEEAARLARDRDVTHTYNAVHSYWNSQMTREHVLEFTRDRKSMSVFVRQSSTGKGWLLVKGAPESLLERSSHIFVNRMDSAIPITQIHKGEIDRVHHEFASEGLRCLGIAFKYLDTKQLQIDNDDYSQVESNLTFVGVVGMLDPPRPEVKDAIRVCKDAGIRVIVITGDNKKTAEEVCREIGLFGAHEDLNGKSFTGGDFMGLSESEQSDAVRHATLFSRVMPKHKQHLVNLLQKHKEVVAMTGDGVNDAPALKKADIGIGMGSGMEVAKHAADMILADDNFATIVSAVEEGRAIYSNTKQFIRYLISSNIGEVVCIFLTAALGFPEALIPVQLLWVNLVTDGLPATALGFNKPDRDIMTRPPRGRTEKIINGWMFFRYFLIGTYVGAATILGFYWWFCWYSDGPQVTFGQLTHFYACNQNSDTNRL